MPQSKTLKPQLLLRTAMPADAAGVANLLGQMGYECSRDDAAERILIMQDEPTQLLIVADLHGELHGLLALDFMYFLPLGRDTCRITALVVDEAHRKSGIGRALLRDADQRARQAGAARIEVTTTGHRQQAHQFYKACGYTEGSVRLIKQLGDA